jgi:hypothetical protein
MENYKTLRQFSEAELLLSEDEARTVLKFIFKPTDHKLITSLPMDNRLIGFAQGLLLEAIDASYSVGFIEAIFRSSSNPTKGAIAVIKKFGKKATKHWFKHATATDLQDVKIYDFVRNRLAVGFRSQLAMFLTSSDASKNSGFAQFIDYSLPTGQIRVWG